jgi:RNA polymerase sigma factor (sigma-70 family)
MIYIFLFTKLILITTIFYYVNSIVFIQKFLSKNQMNLINKILVNPNTPNDMRYKVYNILYTFYDQWAFTQAYQFKQLHKYKCQHISTTELYTYASSGLYKSIQKYNPKYKCEFTHYANYFVQGELLKGLTDLHPISSISKTNRKKGYSDVKKKRSKVQLISENQWILDKIIKDKVHENEPHDNVLTMFHYMSLWEKIHELQSFYKKVIYYKYNFFFEKIRTNKEVADLMCCSEEWVRISSTKALLTIKNQL